MRGRDLAAEYESRWPETGCSESQKEERMERVLLKEDKRTHRLSMRNRGIIVPRLPWKEAA